LPGKGTEILRRLSRGSQEVAWLLIKVPKTCVGEKIAFSVNPAGKIGYPHEEDWN
jgi:hypothetical protein